MRSILVATILFISLCANSQVNIKTNILSDVFASPSLGMEVGLAPRWSFDAMGEFNGWTLSHDRRWKHWALQPGVRYWFCDRFSGHFVGAHMGYKVGDVDVFSGFTSTGINDTDHHHWYDVSVENMMKDYYGADAINSQVMELYTNPKKLQSVTFPITGYRDYDQYANVYEYPLIGFIWLSEYNDKTNSYFFKYGRNASGNWIGGIFPKESFYNTDGFGVRPVKTE